MTWIAAAFLVASFLVLLQVMRVPSRVAEIGAVGRSALRTIRDPDLSDADKEKAMRAGSLRLFGLCGLIVIAVVAALAVPAGLVALVALTGLVDFDAALERTLSWQILVGATLVGLFGMRLLARPAS
ncbi:MAG: hypothetical protein KDC98_22090 [Planctomycetes bacterium]|nr:hypothetical protein [Planctomycetota bacterium]